VNTKEEMADTEEGRKNGKYATKRGFYMDYPMKVAKCIPSPYTWIPKILGFLKT
jgi:hypothetical protein